MNGIERVLNAIRGEPGHPVPRGELVLDRGFAKMFVHWKVRQESVDVLSDTDLLIACGRLLKLDLFCIPADPKTCGDRILAPPQTDIAHLATEGFFVFSVVDGAFQAAVAERGIMALLKDIAQSPSAVGRELQLRSQEVMADIARGVGAGAHGILIADDIAYGQSTYMSPHFVKDCILPVWRSQVAAAHGLGVPVFLHSDGNLERVLSHIVAAGFDGLQCLEPAAGMDIAAIKDKYGKALCLMGNIDPALLDDTSDQSAKQAGYDELRRAVASVMTGVGSRGGFIFGSCSGLYAGMLPERVHYMYQVAAESDPVA